MDDADRRPPRGSLTIVGCARLVIGTLFVPPIVLLVPLYLTIVDVPFVHLRLIDNYWAIWLPAGASPPAPLGSPPDAPAHDGPWRLHRRPDDLEHLPRSRCS